MRRTLLAVLASLTFAMPAIATTDVPVSSVESILTNPQDEQRVVLRGEISGNANGNDYRLSDQTGSIRLDLKQEVTQGESLAGKIVEVEGTVDDKLFGEPTLQAENITVIGDERQPSGSASQG